MAVIESKGDGFSLFNGVKLPSLPEWDKTVYPYAMIYDYESIRNTLIVSTIPLSVIVSAGRVTATAECYTRLQNKSDESPWVLGNETARAAGWKINGLPIWSNYDIINTDDNSVYLSASDPIPLDGMNVIEWDGDTTGLENMSGLENFWLVSEIADVDTNREAVFVRYRSSSDDLTVYNTVPSVVDGFFKYKTMVYYVATASETYTTTGLHFCNNGSLWCQLFAYYPIEQEPEDTESIGYIEYMVNPKYRKYPFRGFFGWLWAKKHIGGGSDVAKSALVSSDGYTLQDVNGLNLIPKEGN